MVKSIKTGSEDKNRKQIKHKYCPYNKKNSNQGVLKHNDKK